MSIAALTSDDETVNGQGGDLAFVRVLGPVQVVTASRRSLDLPSASQQRLVALLATEAPRSLRNGLDLRRTGCFFERAADNGFTRPQNRW